MMFNPPSVNNPQSENAGPLKGVAFSLNPGDGVSKISGVGPERLKKLNSLGVFSIADLINFFPRDYEDRSRVSPIDSVIPGMTNTVRGLVKSKPTLSRAKGLVLTKARISDSSGGIEACWFNQPYLANTLKPGREYFFTGRVSERAGRFQMESPDFEPAGEEESLNHARIIPKYPLKGLLSQKTVRKFIGFALESAKAIADYLPAETLERRGLMGRGAAVRNIHFPESDEMFYAARKRLVFDEFFALHLALSRMKQAAKIKSEIKLTRFDYLEIFDRLSFRPTEAQKSAIEDISADFKSGLVMARLIQGDVGSGKTLVAAAAAGMAIASGYQAVLMAPTEILAEQHYAFFRKIFGESSVALLTGRLTKAQKSAVYAEISGGGAKMVIGTHAILEEGVTFSRLGLAITDEQHRFGVAQRARLAAKGMAPHVLVMSATPIPRTLALTLFGDLDVSVMGGMPPGRQKIDTYRIETAMRPRVFGMIRREVKAGRQAYIVCPAVEESEKFEALAAVEYAEKFRRAFPDLRAALLHGRMKPAEKDAVMRAFAEGGADVLIATTVIEVGIDVPNAAVMVVENADRFGLSQLHQLRGRVGRGTAKSVCVLISGTKSKPALERLDTLTKTNDGFKISEADLKQRGHGDFFGVRQAGLPEFKLANLYEDMEILAQAREEAENFSGDLAGLAFNLPEGL